MKRQVTLIVQLEVEVEDAAGFYKGEPHNDTAHRLKMGVLSAIKERGIAPRVEAVYLPVLLP